MEPHRSPYRSMVQHEGEVMGVGGRFPFYLRRQPAAHGYRQEHRAYHEEDKSRGDSVRYSRHEPERRHADYASRREEARAPYSSERSRQHDHYDDRPDRGKKHVAGKSLQERPNKFHRFDQQHPKRSPSADDRGGRF